MIYIHTGKVTGSKYCTFGNACFYLADIPIWDIPYSFLLLRTLMLPLPWNAVLHSGLAGPYKYPHLWPGGHTAPSAPTASPTQAFCYRLPGAWSNMYTFIPYTNYPAFRQWLPCNAVSHPDPAGWCKRLCSGTVDAQRLPRLRRLLRKLSAISYRVLDRICTRLYLT